MEHRELKEAGGDYGEKYPPSSTDEWSEDYIISRLSPDHIHRRLLCLGAMGGIHLSIVSQD